MKLEHPNTAVGDVAYWGLTSAQATRYHSRLTRMHADACGRFADLAVMRARKAEIAARISVDFAVLALAVLVVGRVVA